MLGFMLPTGGLSMWISNTASTAMMLPISEAVLDALESTHKKKKRRFLDEPTQHETDIDSNYENQPLEDKKNIDAVKIDLERNNLDPKSTHSKEDEKFKEFAKGITLIICYSANIGGTGTLVGTPPNAIMKGHADLIWQEHGYSESSVTFASWLIVGMPTALICLVFLWLWLTVFFNGIRSLIPFCIRKSEDDIITQRVIDDEYRALGKITFSQVAVGLIFILMVLLWFFRSPSFMTGWGDLAVFKRGYTHDAVTSMLIVVLLCAIPSSLPKCRSREKGPIDMLLDWHTIQTKFPWGVIFLVGGGYCLAKASEKTGLSSWIAGGLSVMTDWPEWLMVIVICLTTAFITEVTSNSATTTILMPIVGGLAEQAGYSPIYLMFPVTMSASFAFMLPAATLPNALSFSSGRIRIVDMIKGGFIMNFICVAVVTFTTQSWAVDFLNMREIPWAGNYTSSTGT